MSNPFVDNSKYLAGKKQTKIVAGSIELTAPETCNLLQLNASLEDNNRELKLSVTSFQRDQKAMEEKIRSANLGWKTGNVVTNYCAQYPFRRKVVIF
jgi:hypothetical protein